MKDQIDNRPPPKQRKHPQLWQSYLFWRELQEIQKKHTLRISSTKKGKANFDIEFEELILKKIGLGEEGELLPLAAMVKPKNKGERALAPFQMMVDYGQAVGPIWEWCLSYKGLGESLTGQLLAHIDDIGKFATIAKLWRFAGYGTFEYWIDEGGNVQAPVEGNRWINKEKIWTVTRPKSEWNGYAEATYREPEPDWKLVRHRDINVATYHSPFNRILKAVCFNIADQFIRHQSPVWSDIYYEEKGRQREKHPTAICLTCGAECDHSQKEIDEKLANVFTCPEKKSHKKQKYTDAHIHNRAWRKMIKAFLAELWLTWREYEGLPVSDPFVDGVIDSHDLSVIQGASER